VGSSKISTGTNGLIHLFMCYFSPLTDGIFRAQKWLKGSVVLTVHEATQGSVVTVQFTGKERTTVPGLLSIASAEHLLFDESIDISKLQVESVVEAGVYRLAFSFYLPASISPSIQIDDGKGGTAFVEYSLTAHYAADPSVTASRPITIVGAPWHKEKPFLQEPKAISLKSFGVLDQGRLLIATKLYNTHIGKGERLKCGLTIQNQSKLELERIDLQLVETIDWRASGREKQQVTVLVMEPGVGLPGPAIRPTASPEHGDEISPITVEEMIAQLSWKHQTFELKVPQRSIESYTGTLLTVKHAFKVFIYVKGRAQNPIAAVTANIRICDPSLEEYGHLRDRHLIKPTASDEVAQTKWLSDAETLNDHHEAAAHVPTTIGL
jgi:hypothetical protein